MKKTELQKMSRLELIEIIYALQQEEKLLEEEKKKLEDTIANWTIQIEEAGSIAEAAIKINGVFEAAQTAANQYLDHLRKENSQAETQISHLVENTKQEQALLLSQAQEQADSIVQEANQYRSSVQRECKLLISQTEESIKEKWAAFDRRVQSLLESHNELSVFLGRSSLERHTL